jgi:hypothetical protein
MSRDVIKLRSSIKPYLTRHILFRGTLLAGIGALFLLISGIFLPPAILTFWGFPIFLLSVGLIACGLLPYRRLKRLEVNPYILTLENGEWIHFLVKGKPVFSIPYQSIASVEWMQKKYRYGIKILLKTPLPKPLLISNKKFNYENYHLNCMKKYQCDLFFPYFSEQALKSILS